MTKITINVATPKNEPSVHRFDSEPIIVGRDESCQLAINHPVVPRKLCRVWTEGNLIRVEEFPGLTNPVTTSRGQVVCGGISGKSLALTVGPVKLSMQLDHTGSEDDAVNNESNRPKRSNPVVLFGGSALIIALVVKLIWPGANSAQTSSDSVANLPETPIPSSKDVSCEHQAMCMEKTRLSYTRAMEILGRPAITPAQKIEATLHLQRSLAYQSRADPKPTFEENADRLSDTKAATQLKRLQSSIESDYRLQLFMLRQALKQKNRELARKPAGLLASYLKASDPKGALWLQELAKN